MKKSIFNLAIVLALSVVMSSCYTLTYTVGDGAQTGVTVKEKNHYLIYGLFPVGTSSPTEMAGGATDYTVTIQHTFLDGLISAITFGIYNPTTTEVQK